MRADGPAGQTAGIRTMEEGGSLMPYREMLSEIEKIPVIDVHSHLCRDQLAVSHPAQVLLYHMLVYELCAAGASEDVSAPWRGPEEDPEEALQKCLPYFSRLSNTGFGWCLGTILRDLYEFDEPVSLESYPRLREAMERKVRQPDWGLQVIRRGGVVRTLTSTRKIAPLRDGQPDPGLRLTFEALPFNTHGLRWEKMNACLTELETSCGYPIRSAADFQEVFSAWFEREGLAGNKALVAWMNGMVNGAELTPSDAAALLAKVRGGSRLIPEEQERMDGMFLRAILGALRGKVRVFQYIIGCTVARTRGRVRLPLADGMVELGAQIGRLLVDFPDLHMDVLNGYEPAEPALCSAAARLPNLSLSSMWWHNFYPSVMERLWQRRIDMVPQTGLCGFFSDAYCVDWQYARLRLTQRVLAKVLADRVQSGWMTPPQALELARRLLFENPRRIFLPDDTIEM
jgi:hypothetical protein